MKLTKSQKIWFGLLGAGLCALVIDQAGGQGTAAEAAQTESITVDATAVQPTRARNELASAIAQPLSTRLNAFAESTNLFTSVRDAFAFPAGRPSRNGGATFGSSSEDAEQFLHTHALKAILRNGGRRQAWVNGSIVEEGQRLDGATLIAVQNMSATFELDGTRVVLVLPDSPTP